MERDRQPRTDGRNAGRRYQQNEYYRSDRASSTGAGRDPRYAQHADPRTAQRGRDPRYAQYADPRTAQRGRDPRYAQYADPRTAQRGRDPRYAQYADPRAAQYTDPRVEAYIRQRREAQMRAERARRMEYERRRAAAREARRRLEEQLKRERKLRRQRMRKIFLGRAAVCLVVFAMLATVTGIFALLHFNSSPDAPPSKIIYTCGGEKIRTADESFAYKGGNLYVCFNDVANYLGLAVSGDTHSMKFVFTDKDNTEFGSAGSGVEDSVIFTDGSRNAVINGQTEVLPAESFSSGEEMWVSAEFITEYMEGVSMTRDGKNLHIARLEDSELSTKDAPVFLEASLKLKNSGPLPDIDLEDDEDEDTVITTAPMPEDMEFISDLGSYEEYMAPEDDTAYLTLVNGENPLAGNYEPPDLTDIANTRQDGRATQQLQLYAAKALDAMFIEMQAAGYTDVSVMSGYRDYWTQNYLHNYYIEQEMASDPSLTWEAAEAIVLTYSVPAGTSEHQSGLCVDMHNLESADVSFADDPAFEWLSDNSWKFGFVLRYPANKTEETGVSFEPWHWRYVGRKAAWEIYSGNLCLEEYAAR